MKYLVKGELVDNVLNSKENLDKKTIEYTIKYLEVNNLVSFRVDYHHDIYVFYKKALAHYLDLGLSKKAAKIDTMIHFDISKNTLYRIIKSHQAGT